MSKLIVHYIKKNYKNYITLLISLLLVSFITPFLKSSLFFIPSIFFIGALVISMNAFLLKSILFDDLFDNKKQLIFTLPISNKKIVGSRIILSLISLAYILISLLLSNVMIFLATNIISGNGSLNDLSYIISGIFENGIGQGIIELIISLFSYIDFVVLIILLEALVNSKVLARFRKNENSRNTQTVLLVILSFFIICIIIPLFSSISYVFIEDNLLLNQIIRLFLTIAISIIGYLSSCYILDYYIEI